MAAMFQEIASLFPTEAISEKQMEDHLVQRFEQIIIESSNDDFALCEGQLVTDVASDFDSTIALGPSDEMPRRPYPEAPRERQRAKVDPPKLQPSSLHLSRIIAAEDPPQQNPPTRTRSGTMENPIQLTLVQERVAQYELKKPVISPVRVDAPAQLNIQVEPEMPAMKKALHKAPTTTAFAAAAAATAKKDMFTPSYRTTEEEKKDDTEPPQLPVMHEIFHEHVPGMVTDEEIGIAAMFREIHGVMPAASGQEVAREAMAQLWTAWTAVQRSAAASLAAAQEVTRSAVDQATALHDDNEGAAAAGRGEEDISMAAMFREVRDSLRHEPEIDTKVYLDALLANMLHTYAQAREMVSPVVTQAHEMVSPTVTPKTLLNQEEDISLAGMFKEIANHFSGSDQQAETYMINRLERLLCLSEASTVASTDVNEISTKSGGVQSCSM